MQDRLALRRLVPGLHHQGQEPDLLQEGAQDRRKPPLERIPHYQYFDWTKGGNGPWSDVYYRHDHKVVIGAIMRDV